MDGRKEAYDRGSTIFSPDGRLYQVEYAREAVARGSPGVGVRTPDGVVLAATRRLRSPLLEPESVEKLYAVTDRVGVVGAGHAADARSLVDFARVEAQRHRLRYGEPVGVEPLTTAVCDRVQETTQSGGTRPYGAALLVGGTTDGDPALFRTDPSGAANAWRAAAIGDGHDGIREYLETGYDPGLSLDAGVDLAVEALAAADGTTVDADRLAVARLTADGYAVFDRETRADRLAGLGLAG